MKREPPGPPQLYRVSAVAKLTGLHINTVSKYCRQGKLRSVVINERGDRLIPATEIARLVALAEAGLPLPDRAP